MLLKRIEAKTLPQALERVRSECGADAMVVETRATQRGYLVVAGIVQPLSPAHRSPTDQAGRRAPSDTPRWTRGFRALAAAASDFGLSERIVAAVENALLGTRVELGRAGDPALPGLAVRVLAALIKTEPRFEAEPTADFRAIALIGATGVGKTTTLAKLATRAVRRGENVAILTVDTYRTAAVEQLRAFADLLDVPMEVAFTPQDLRRALQQHGHRDRVFVDTTGKSPLDREALAALGGALNGGPVARLLCLAAGTHRRDADVVLDHHDRLGIDGVCLTKWDETVVPGEAVAAVVERGLPLSHVGIGQEVPADIVAADAAALARAAFALPADGALA